ncbi:MAG: M15 family metallopeptidase [Methylobacteriaceae bacterium]|nr:M15 family metallopeptidase [Methylobacteriaceae bacterium]MBV9245452.1 M15 family metallopeptidase [Methylobacteriaceae bacterium]MBV9635068.1 M15 family metallopeptidase [Methylobacteriaceae bacterium]MBV9704390.1 M15 family metallopeptidase [Methylobacteriaceae bacterium]
MPTCNAARVCIFLTCLAETKTCAAADLPTGFVRLAAVAPAILQDIRYAGSDNFTGRPVPGYGAPACWLRKDAAEALSKVEKDLAANGLGLIVYDCYRPQRATDAFLRWAADPGDQSAKASFYPNVDKRTLFAYGYIAQRSSHSTGTAVDVALVRLAEGAVPKGLDFGTPFDRFDPRSATASPAIASEARQNRESLVAVMGRYGFENYRNEWWHFSLRTAGATTTFDVEIK